MINYRLIVFNVYSKVTYRMNNFAMESLRSERHVRLPNVDSILKISLGLVLLTAISSALVYAETIPVDVEGNSFDVNYDVTGMTLSSITTDTDFISLILNVDVESSGGKLDIVLDRSFFDSVYGGLDDDFIILADGIEPAFSEIDTSSQSRTLSIELPAGTQEIEIIGSVFGDSKSDVIVDVPDADKAAADKAAADKAAADKAAADKAAADKAAADKAAADKAAADKAAADKAAADKAAADKAAADKKQSTQCGPGTILKNGACVLDERCGPGTILEDGACVLDSTQPSSGSSSLSAKGMGKEMIMGVVVAFVAAGTIGIILGLMSKASKSKR